MHFLIKRVTFNHCCTPSSRDFTLPNKSRALLNRLQVAVFQKESETLSSITTKTNQIISVARTYFYF